MKFCWYGKDGGPESKVWAYTLIEIKSLFSIILLRFEEGSREVFHTHAFNALSWVLKGKLKEVFQDGSFNVYNSSLKPITTKRFPFHQVRSEGRTWALSFRGPWKKTWDEYHPNEIKYISLTNHRVVIN